ncbi:NAD(P)/FAD-dependent oxidoreductase [Mesorhizobium sp. 1B3]|uniref:NAD(P)/FAD-dependent oxidoreductase n=1 Tax=Mesorhizobium sp. 1B3 TaxID=3243599 RepID=UPI003D955441
MAECIVLGAGMVGVGAALALQQRGNSVVLADRRAPGEETSYGNAGIIQVEAVEPYAFPRSPGEIVSAALGLNDQVRWRAGSIHRWALPLTQYFIHSSPENHRRISAVYSRMIRRAGSDHAPLIEAAGAQAIVRRDGFRQVHRTQRSFEEAARDAERIAREYGVGTDIESADQLAASEPNLRRRLAGAVRWTEAWSCSDPGGLVAAYAKLFSARGGSVMRADAYSLVRAGKGWRIDGPEGVVEAENAIVALGPWSGEFLRRFGYRVPLFFKRGYHRHYQGKGPDLPMIDADKGAVVSPMKAGLRLLTGAELTWLESSPSMHQARHVRRAVGELFELGDPVEARPWYGNRPCMPGMLPVVGRAPRHQGLWLNFGHGHQGFTLGPTTGEMLARAMEGDGPLPAELQLMHVA